MMPSVDTTTIKDTTTLIQSCYIMHQLSSKLSHNLKNLKHILADLENNESNPKVCANLKRQKNKVEIELDSTCDKMKKKFEQQLTIIQKLGIINPLKVLK